MPTFFIILFLLLIPATIAFGEDGSAVVVVYNKNLKDSEKVAHHYAESRKVPDSNIIGIEFTDIENITREEYREKFESTLLTRLLQVGLFKCRTNSEGKLVFPPSDSKIKYALLCHGVPYRIVEDKSVQDKGVDNIPPELRKNEASVDSELACLPLGSGNYPITGPYLNPVYLTTNKSLLHPTNGILLVTRLDGPSPDIACTLVDKAIFAEKNGLWGYAYFDRRGITNGNEAVADGWFASSALWCRRFGYETVEDTAPETFNADFPMCHIAIYAGWYAENVCGPFSAQNVEFVPGAIAYHLHSFNAEKLRSSKERWVGPLLSKGATITFGSVNEPMLGGTPNIYAFLIMMLFQGASFGEAFIAAQHALSWQNIGIGDPLYRPFEKNIEQFQREFEKTGSTNLQWTHLHWVNINLSANRAPITMISYIEKLPFARKSSILQEKLAHLYQSLNKYDDALEAYETALKNQCSTNHRIKISISYIDLLCSLGREHKALDYLNKLSQSYPECVKNGLIAERLKKITAKVNGK